MCGIAGYIGFDERLGEALLRCMHHAQRHRGPDDTGIMTREQMGGDGRVLRVGMAHARLSILDISAAGHQPMSTPDERHWICYNGEFYNSPECREKLKQAGVVFRSQSDTEVLMACCAKDGVETTVRHVNGMFAFSFYNHAEGVLILARDRAGQKPLYYMQLGDGSLLYASEIPALLTSGLVNPDAIDEQALDHFWTVGYTMGERTAFRNIRRLPPGHTLKWTRDGVVFSRYWSLRFEPDEQAGRSIDDFADELEHLLQDAVRLRLLSDVPVGVCLSGGVDSALIALMMSRLRRDIPAYTIAFDDSTHDESAYAAALARHLGLPHEVLTVNANRTASFATIARWFGEPFGDFSAIPMWFLSELIRRRVTVALTGDGGDELFGGYDHYGQWFQACPAPRGVSDFRLQGVAGGGTPSSRKPPDEGVGGSIWQSSLRALFRNFALRVLGVSRSFPLMQRHVNGRLRRRIHGPGMAGARHSETLRERRQWMRGARQDALAAMQDCDFHTYMTDDVLMKVDRMSMAHGLECRSPFMDYRVMEFAAKLPARVKLGPDGTGKLLLRHILARHLPRALYDRPKQGFTPPWERWCVGELRAQLRGAWQAMDDAYTRRDAVESLVPSDRDGSPVLSWMAYSYVQSRGA